MLEDGGIFEMDEQLQARSPEMEEIFARYRYLSQESLRLKSLSRQSSPTSPLSSPSSKSLSSALSSWSKSPPYHSDSDISPTPFLPRVAAGSAGSETNQLYDINQQIKATLMSLLNCEEVKHDAEFRAWVQERLMEAEHELKRQRRRRNSVEREEGGRRWEGMPVVVDESRRRRVQGRGFVSGSLL